MLIMLADKDKTGYYVTNEGYLVICSITLAGVGCLAEFLLLLKRERHLAYLFSSSLFDKV